MLKTMQKPGRPLNDPVEESLMELEAKALSALENEAFDMEARKVFAQLAEMAFTVQALIGGGIKDAEGYFHELVEKTLGGSDEA